ncbi:DUF295 domain-containing protein, partial [Cephalotus follicularis]
KYLPSSPKAQIKYRRINIFLKNWLKTLDLPTVMAVDWTQLPQDIIETISKNLRIYTDYLNFRWVCHTWRSSTPKIPHHLPPQLPLLMVSQSPQQQQPHQSSRCAFFNISNNKLRFLNLPELSHRNRHCGSSQGWLIILDESPIVLLLNPLTRAKIYLPPLSSFPHIVRFSYSDMGSEYGLRSPSGGHRTLDSNQMRDRFIKKVVLSSSPSEGTDFVAIAILNNSGGLAYCRNGDTGWTIIQDAHSYYEDVISYKGVFYAVDKFGEIAVCNVRGGHVGVSFIETPSQIGGDMQYLVELGGEFLLVTRFIHLEPDIEPNHLVFRTKRFEVFRLDRTERKWERLTNLGEQMLFLGRNSSLSLSAADFPGCVGNCIYYTDNNLETHYNGVFGEHDVGLFNLSDGSIEPLSCFVQNSYLRLLRPTSIWVTPNPW